jgi:hypothetical protein
VGQSDELAVGQPVYHAGFRHMAQLAPVGEYYRLALLNTCNVDILKFSGQLR